MAAPMSSQFYQNYADETAKLNPQAAMRPQGPAQFNDFPSWLGQQNTQPLMDFQKQIPGLFNTAGMSKAYHDQINGTMAQGRASAAAAGAAYGARAQQVGASGMGAGFAQAQAMLPIYGQQNALLSDLERNKMQARGNQASATGTVASQLSSMAAQREGMMADYAKSQQSFQLQQQQLQQQQSQFAQQFAAQNSGNLNTQAARRGSASPYGDGNTFSGQMTSVGDHGGAQFTPQFRQFLESSGQRDLLQSGPPRYPGSVGLTGGAQTNALNANDAYYRNLSSIASGGQVAPWNINMLAGQQGSYNRTNITSVRPRQAPISEAEWNTLQDGY